MINFTLIKILNKRQFKWYKEIAIYNFVIIYKKGSENARADTLSRRGDYIGKTVDRPQTIFQKGKYSLECKYELLAIVSIIKNNELANRIKLGYTTDEYAARILKNPTEAFKPDLQRLL